MKLSNSLNKLAMDVLKKYNIIPEDITIIQSGSIKTVWKIKTRDSVLCLKRLKQTMDKAQFSVNAQIYIKNSNGNVPDIILSSANTPIVEHNNELFVVYEWLKGKDLNLDSPQDLSLAIKGLAKFHVASKGYEAKDASRISSKVDKCPSQYNSMKNKFVAWKEISKNENNSPCYTSYLKYVDSIVEISNMAIDLINKSSYKELMQPSSNALVLCHQDFGVGNALLTPKGLIVIDLDGVTFDLPSRDLRKIIMKQAQTKGKWAIDDITNIINWYSEVNPLTDKEKQVLYIDLLFPHYFFGILKNLFQKNKAVKAEHIERVSMLEESKVSLLKQLITKGELI